ncbi:NAD-dependent glycerol-3-phosphate dehydrogenase [Phytophthora infestans]|uniref:NAD-dependent glycerol-3-phosphate dehydrogenase n=1 Tax=Phytophthora infestans TaxID=4787 RepID=A0A833T4N1_PHYIN|nr:NAD-dependent glycerol-3-phosphate dehydrogenase [Phytophthora infestans]
MEGLNNGATMAGMPSAEVEKVKVTVLAAGAFGIAMATLVARRKHDVFLYARDANVVQTINETHRSPRVFPQFNLLPNIRATTSVAEATSDAKIVIVCLPAQLTPDFLAQYRDDVPTDAVLVITCKGLYLKTKQLLAEPILEALQRDQPLAFLSGPSFALELMNKCAVGCCRGR